MTDHINTLVLRSSSGKRFAESPVVGLEETLTQLREYLAPLDLPVRIEVWTIPESIESTYA